MTEDKRIKPFKNGKLPKNEIVRAELKKLENKDGSFEARDVVEVAKKPTHPFHKYFLWDNNQAAENYRLFQARILIASIKVEIRGHQTSQYWNAKIETEEVSQRGYFSLDTVLSKKDLHKQVVEAALKELEYWTQKYKTISETKGIVDETRVKQVKRKLKIK